MKPKPEDEIVELTSAPDQLTAEMWRDILLQEGVPTAINAGDVASFLGVSSWPCRLMVKAGDLVRARAILDDIDFNADDEDSLPRE